MLEAARRDAVAQYVLDQARYAIETFGLRPPGSEGETQCQHHVRGQLEACCDGPVSMEPFPVAQKAFMSAPAVSAVLMLAGFAAYWHDPKLAAASSVWGLLVFVFVIGRYWRFLDPFFPKKTSHNVIGRIAPKESLKRRIILNGHPDAAYEWRWLYRFPKGFKAIMAYVFAGMAVTVCVHLAAAAWPLSGSAAPQWLGWLQVPFLPAILFGLFYTDFRHVSHGANDNLTGAFIVTGIARQLREAGLRPQRTEILIAINGSEEAGLRGAKAMMERHRGEYDDVETIAIAVDTMRDLAHMAVYDKDMNGTVRHDPRVCRLLKDAGARAGHTLPYATVFLGSSDAAAFTQAGLPSALLAAMDPAPADYYHNRRDHWRNMDAAAVRATVDVLAEAIAAYDAEGLPA